MLVDLTPREIEVIRAAINLVAENNRNYSAIVGPNEARTKAITELEALNEKLMEILLNE